MRPILIAVMLSLALATPVFAAKLYLKDGGVIQAIRVWRSDGKVYVLATRHTMTSFEPCEVDLKRTFAKRHKAAKRPASAGRSKTAAPLGAAIPHKTAERMSGE